MRETIILIADDDKADRLFLRRALMEINPAVKIHEVIDGEELISFLKNTAQLPSLIISDINMPKQNGFEVMEFTKNQGKFNHVPVLFFSTSSCGEDISKALRLGAKDYISKPASILGYGEVAARIYAIIAECRTLTAPKDFFLLN